MDVFWSRLFFVFQFLTTFGVKRFLMEKEIGGGKELVYTNHFLLAKD